MSRVIIKNIPNGYNETKLRDHFSRCGIVTDVQLKYTPEGKFRNFGFVGFESDENATAAIKHFNNSFLLTSKISVEPCVALNETKKQKVWSKYAKNKEEEAAAAEREKEAKELADRKAKKEKPLTAKEILGQRKHDPLFKEFVEAQQKAGKAVWDNMLQQESDADTDDSEEAKPPVEDAAEEVESAEQPAKKERATEKKIDPGKLFVAKVLNIPSKVRRLDLIRFFRPIKPYSIRIPPKQRGFAYVGYKTESELQKALLKDKSFLLGKQARVVDFTEKNRLKDADGKGNPEKKQNPKWIRQKEAVQSESICESGKLFFRNLTYSVKEENLKELFEKYGPVSEIDLPIDPNTRMLKGFGTVAFLMPEHAVAAYNGLNGTFFHGRMFHILPAAGNEIEQADDDGADESSYKKKKEKELQKMAQSTHNWNTLFMGENAIAEAVARKYGTTKEQIVSTDSGSTSAAVRLALGETEIVMEMQRFLEENDICLDAFNATGAAVKRSNTVILAKNLPAGTTVPEIRDKFATFGILGRVVLPPSGVTAVIEYLDPSEAKKGFKKLAYTRFKTSPLYLEWAPERTFSRMLDESERNSRKSEAKPAEATAADERQQNVDESAEPEEGTTLFLKNLSFATNEKAIQERFQRIGTIHSIQIARNRTASDSGQNESRGYGFIQFKLRKDADAALKTLQSVEIDGRLVELSRSDRTMKRDRESLRKSAAHARKQTGSKILVRNIPFQANSGEVRDLFKAFGEIKTVRLPRKMASGGEEDTHRGFGFVDFLQEHEAKQAFNALSKSTHLYGRRLVLEWAEAEEDVTDLRKRTGEKFTGDSDTVKRSRKSVFDASAIGNAGETIGGHDDDSDGGAF